MTMITPSYLGETIEYSSLHACRSTLEDPTSGGAARARAVPVAARRADRQPRSSWYRVVDRLLAGVAGDDRFDDPQPWAGRRVGRTCAAAFGRARTDLRRTAVCFDGRREKASRGEPGSPARGQEFPCARLELKRRRARLSWWDGVSSVRISFDMWELPCRRCLGDREVGDMRDGVGKHRIPSSLGGSA